jgi:ferric-dicitrate binding protein FerR (iron transport regulator)
MSASPKPPSAPIPSLSAAPRRPSAPRAAPLFEVGVPAPAPVPRPSGPCPAPASAPAAPRPPAPVKLAAPAPRPPRKRRRRSAWPFYLAMGLILAALPAGYFLLLQDAPPSAQETALPGRPVELRVTRVDGTVEIRHASGQWGQVKPGDVLQPSDGVRTGAGATAILSGGDQYEVSLEPQTEVAVDELTDSISRVMLGTGMATAKVKAGKHTFEVHARNSDAVARTRQGTFAISNNAMGTVAVGTRDGEVEFAGRGKTVIVRAGQQSVVRPGQAPSDPTELPSSLLLHVEWPAGKILTHGDVTVAGTSDPGAVVTVQGHSTVVDAKGNFHVRLKLKDGKVPIKVKARSVAGLQEEAEQEVRIDSHAPKVQLDSLPWNEQH